MAAQDTFAKWVFAVAAIYGIAVMFPQYFMEAQLGRDFPPPLTHPEHFYGFIGVVLAWQCAFLVIASDVQRYRPLMVPAMLEKLAFGPAVLVLYAQERVAPLVVVAGVIDLVIGVFFYLAFRATRSDERANAISVTEHKGLFI